jgi:hypothetical protein
MAGAIIAYARRSRTYRGYREVAGEVRTIARAFRGEVFRDGDDLVIGGNMDGLPATVRFSQMEDTPGVSIRMEAASTFQMSIVPQGSAQSEGKAVLRTGDTQFDSRFTTRTDEPTQARMLLGSRGVTPDLQKLCCSSKTFISIVPGALEVSELLIPEQSLGRHIIEHLKQMARIGRSLQQLPGSEAIRIMPIRRERYILARLAIGIGIVAAIATVVKAYEDRQHPPVLTAAPGTPSGIPPAEWALISGSFDWRLAKADDFDGAALTWARNNNIEVAGRIRGDFSGLADARDVAYVLRRKDGTFRVIILSKGGNRFDLTYEQLAFVALVPRQAFSSIQWVGRPPEEPEGDGLLIAYRPGDVNGSVIVYLSGDRTTTGAPANYQSLSF